MFDSKRDPVQVINLPDLPPKVDLKDLSNIQKGQLLDEEVVKKIKKMQKEGKLPPGHYSKKWLRERGISSDYSLLVKENALYAIYKGEKQGKHLGSGAWGKVKLIQNIDTNEWKVAKVIDEQKIAEDKSRPQPANLLEAIVLPEHTILSEVHRTQDNITERKFDEQKAPKRGKKYYLTMDYVQGVELFEFLKEHTALSAKHALDIAIGAAECIQELHNKGYVHRDIKPGNMLYDPRTGKVSVIDLGFAEKMNEDYEINKEGRRVSGYGKYTSSGAYAIEFPIAADTYSLGKFLEELFGLEWLVHKKIKIKSPCAYDPIIKDLVESILRTDPRDERGPPPPLQAIIDVLKERRDHLELISLETTGIVYAQDVENQLKENKEAFIAALKSVGSIHLVDSKLNSDSTHYQKLKQALEKEGVWVRNAVLISENPTNLTSQIHKLVASDKSVSHLCHFHPPGKNIIQGTTPIEITSTTETADYRRQIERSVLPSPAHEWIQARARIIHKINELRKQAIEASRHVKDHLVRPPPRSGGLDGYEQPQGLPMLKVS